MKNKINQLLSHRKFILAILMLLQMVFVLLKLLSGLSCRLYVNKTYILHESTGIFCYLRLMALYLLQPVTLLNAILAYLLAYIDLCALILVPSKKENQEIKNDRKA